MARRTLLHSPNGSCLRGAVEAVDAFVADRQRLHDVLEHHGAMMDVDVLTHGAAHLTRTHPSHSEEDPAVAVHGKWRCVGIGMCCCCLDWVLMLLCPRVPVQTTLPLRSRSDPQSNTNRILRSKSGRLPNCVGLFADGQGPLKRHRAAARPTPLHRLTVDIRIPQVLLPPTVSREQAGRPPQSAHTHTHPSKARACTPFLPAGGRVAPDVVS